MKPSLVHDTSSISSLHDDISVTTGQSQSTSGHLVFHPSDAEKIQKLFPDMIAGRKTIRQKEVTGVVTEQAPELLEIFSLQQILLRVRTEKRAFDRRNQRKGK